MTEKTTPEQLGVNFKQTNEGLQNPQNIGRKKSLRRPMPASTVMMNYVIASDFATYEFARLIKIGAAVVELSIEKIKYSPYFEGDYIDGKLVHYFAENIDISHGGGIVVRAIEGEVFEVVIGHHYVEALKKSGVKTVLSTFTDCDEATIEALVAYDNQLQNPGFLRLALDKGIYHFMWQ